VNALLLRIHQSGHLAELTKERIELVNEAIAYYKTIRTDIKEAVPFWPLGLADNLDTWVCLGLKTERKAYIAVWRRGGEKDTMELPIAKYLQHYGKQPGDIKVSQSYPLDSPCKYAYCNESGILSVTFDRSTMARIFEVSL
jgi:alpha-galactosidase